MRRVPAAGDERRPGGRQQVHGGRRAAARDALGGRRRARMSRQVDHDDCARAVPLPGRRPVQLRARLSAATRHTPATRRSTVRITRLLERLSLEIKFKIMNYIRVSLRIS